MVFPITLKQSSFSKMKKKMYFFYWQFVYDLKINYIHKFKTEEVP